MKLDEQMIEKMFKNYDFSITPAELAAFHKMTEQERVSFGMGQGFTAAINLLLPVVEKLQESNEDFEKFGTRHDINPTGQMRECGCFDSFKGDQWQSYIRSQDKSVRERARSTKLEVEEMLKKIGGEE